MYSNGELTSVSILQQFLEQNGKDPNVTAALKAFDVYIVPVFNIDGYEYTRKTVSYVYTFHRGDNATIAFVITRRISYQF